MRVILESVDISPRQEIISTGPTASGREQLLPGGRNVKLKICGVIDIGESDLILTKDSTARLELAIANVLNASTRPIHPHHKERP